MNNQSNMKASKPLIRLLGLSALALAVVIVSVNTMVASKLKNLESEITLQIANQQTLLVSLAEAAARNGADEVTEKIIADCNIDERVRFDGLLGRLDTGLQRTDLVELERLFGRCGSFYSERKLIMASRLEREIEIYTAYVTQLQTLVSNGKVEKYNIKDWNALAAEEKKQSRLFSELVNKQDEIITTILAGKSANSVEIKEILRQVSEIQETLVVAIKQTEVLRTRLISL